ncbi:MAG: penicillin-binding protein, partial [Nitrospinae bacterium]|nr:penicillin-binding protein [Nitrospinota bacterium]
MRNTPLLPRSGHGKTALLILCALAIACGMGIGASFTYLYDFPELERLQNYKPNTTTRIYARGGELLAELYQERRKPIPLKHIPATLQQAFLAIEDSRFYDHPGVSYPDIVRAFIKNLSAGQFVQGGSTITQQLAKVLFLTPERKLKRKIREALLALEIERRFTKDEILEFYMNQIYLGSGAYGVQAAAQIYFGKTVAQLTLAESAMIAGLPKAPTRFNPRTNPEKALLRRSLVINRMRVSGFITDEQAKTAREEPFQLAPRVANIAPEAAYFIEKTRIGLSRRFGQSLYK